MINSDKQLLIKEHNGVKVLAVSYSQIDTFLTCNWKWYHTYVEGNRSTEKQESLELGTKIHELFESLLNKKKNHETLELSEIDEGWRKDIYEGEIPFANDENQQIAFDQHIDTIHKFINHESEFSKMVDDQEIESVEEKFWFPFPLGFSVNINGDIFDTVHLNGAIDLEISDFDGKITLIDHKSGKKKFDKKKLEHNMQFPIYVLYKLQQKKNVPSYKCFYHFTRLGSELQEVVITQERLDKTVEELREIFYAMYRGDSYKQKCTALCPWCSFSANDCKKGVKLLATPKEDRKRMYEW